MKCPGCGFPLLIGESERYADRCRLCFERDEAAEDVRRARQQAADEAVTAPLVEAAE